MYWAKKILEWTESPSVALQTAQYFNDKYAIDGCDPNGFVGVGWSIMAIHDQGWKERDIFGKIRFMNYAGCKRKFDVQAFVRQYPPAARNAMEAAKKYGKEPETGKKKPTTTKPAASTAKPAATKKKAGTKPTTTKPAESTAKPSASTAKPVATKKKAGTEPTTTKPATTKPAASTAKPIATKKKAGTKRKSPS